MTTTLRPAMNGHRGRLLAGTWAPMLVNGRRSARVSCPQCGIMATLFDHAINEDGVVTPSLVCPSEVGCDFHETDVILKGWKRS